MAFPKGLELHGNQYRKRHRIPKEVAPHYPGETFATFKTSEPNRDRVKTLYWAWYADLQAEYQRIRETGSRFGQAISPEQIAALAGTHVAESLAVHEGVFIQGFLPESPTFKADFEEAARRRLTELREAGQAADFSLLAGYAQGLLRRFKISLSKDAPLFRVLCHALWKAEKEAYEGALKRHDGDVVETPVPPLLAPSASSSGVPLLSVLVKDFLSRQDATSQMYKKYKATLELFHAFMGDRPGHDLKQRELEDFFACLCRLPPHWKKESKVLTVREIAAKEWPKTLHLNTVEKSYRPALRIFLEDCQRVYHDEARPFPQGLTVKGIKYSGSRTAPEGHQRALRPDELKRLFEGPEYRAFAADPDKAHCYWLPLIGLFTGARVNEVCQLHPSLDIEEEEGVWRFNFTEDTETDERVSKAVKNEPSRRKVPVHPRLLALGFLDYLKIVRERKASLLFPQFPPKAGRASGTAREWFGELIRDAGLRDETPNKQIVGFHCFRSTMTTKGAHTRLPWPIQNIIGHAIPGRSIETEGYIDGELPLAEKAAILRCIDFDIDPPHPSRCR